MLLPVPRGPLTTSLVEALRHCDPSALADAPAVGDPIADDDLQLALWTCYELHYRGFDGVPPEWEWQPELIAWRAGLERQILSALRRAVTPPPSDAPVPDRLWELIEQDDGPSLSRFVQRRANRDQFTEFVIHRSIYQLKEADPHTWAIPRLSGAAKSALLEIQFDEYGHGNLDRMHSELYRRLLRALDLDDSYGAYVDSVPGITLAVGNIMSLFGLHRELRGALVGHLAAYEMTSSQPCRRYAKALRRLGGDDAACEFYDVHVTADALHEQLAARDLCGNLAAAEPELTEDILFGATAGLYVDRRFAEHVLGCWQADRSSLVAPVLSAAS